jgi:hypothetical protein
MVIAFAIYDGAGYGATANSRFLLDSFNLEFNFVLCCVVLCVHHCVCVCARVCASCMLAYPSPLLSLSLFLFVFQFTTVAL